jgi:hypothetical protein
MEAHQIALIKSDVQDGVMELLIAVLLVAIIGVLAQVAGADSRDADTRMIDPAW